MSTFVSRKQYARVVASKDPPLPYRVARYIFQDAAFHEKPARYRGDGHIEGSAVWPLKFRRAECRGHNSVSAMQG